MVISTIQSWLLMLIVLSGIPFGIFLVKATKEEMKDGRKWFKLLVASSLIGVALSLAFAKGDVLALLLTSFGFIFFLSAMPLVRKLK